MMNYYVAEPENNDNYPMLSWDDPRSRNVARNEEVVTTTPVRLRLGAPVPKTPQMVDFHILPEPVISKKLRDVLEPMKLPLVQMVPVQIVTETGTHHDYSLFHVRNRLQCLNISMSRYEANGRGEILILEKPVLDERVLGKVPEEDRRVFRPVEYSGLWLFHEKVMRAIMAARPVGLRFFHVRDWSDTVVFR
jgi:hypothetical protein